MDLKLLDWVVIVLSLGICFIPALFMAARSSKNTTSFFGASRSVPWWLAGLSMVATTFSSDTPNWVTQQVRQYGVAGNWQWWAFVLTGLSTVFFYARLWRRSAVLTDLEFYEVRYSGKAATLVRGFRAIYLGLFFNCCIMATVTLAACKIANVLFSMPFWQTILICGVLNVIFAAHSGLWGVLVIDMIQFFIKMTAVIAAAYFSLVEVAKRFGGSTAMDGLNHVVSTLGRTQVVMQKTWFSGEQPHMDTLANGHGQPILNILPNFNMAELAAMIFIVPIALSWWANWYPGAEPGGGSYIAQRMLAAKSEKDSLGAVLFFNLAHYVLRPWPWIITALCSIIIFPDLESIRAYFPHADPNFVGHDSAFPAMLHFLPVGFAGLMVGGLIAANSSTILTHLNWGSSYLIHDLYSRFIAPDKSQKHYVNMGRLCTLFLYIFAAGLSYFIDSAQDGFQILLSIGAGTGLIYLLRWFWWRINAWCEIVAMISSFTATVAFFIIKKMGHEYPFATTLSLTALITTIAWIITAYVTAPTSMERLVSFYKKVHPAGPGWTKIRLEAGVSEADAHLHGDHMGFAFLGWVSGCITIWSSLFCIGNFLYGRMTNAWILLATFIVSGSTLIWVINNLWDKNPVPVEPPVSTPDRA